MKAHDCEEPTCAVRATCYGRTGGYLWTHRCALHCDHVGEGGIFDRGGAKCVPLCARCGEDVCDCEARP